MGNYPLSVMGVLLAPQLSEVFIATETFGRAMEGTAHKWAKDPDTHAHVELMGFLATIAYPLCTLGALLFWGFMVSGVGV